MMRLRWLIVCLIVGALSVPVAAQYGFWTFVSGGAATMRANTTGSAVTVRQDGAGKIYRALKSDGTEVWSVSAGGQLSTASGPSAGFLFGGDTRCYRSATKTLTCDDGSGGSVTLAIVGVGSATTAFDTPSYRVNGAGALDTNGGNLRIGTSYTGGPLLISPTEVRYAAITFATLPASPANGDFMYCSDCTIANPTASGGTGAFVKRLNGVWVGN
jgi:hypothetical protein